MNDSLVFITDDKYVMPTVVAIKSIEQSAIVFGKEYNVNICAFSLSSSSINIFHSLDSIYIHINLCIIERKAYERRMNQINQNSHVTPTALLKFELPNIFNDQDKILYLDSDIIVKGDLSELFNMELGNDYIAASYEFWKFLLNKYTYKSNDDSVSTFYFNSGVMLMNLKSMRENGIPDKLWECKINKYNNRDNKKFALMDQDVLNEVFGQKKIPLPIKYNCNCKFVNEKYIRDINKVYGTKYDKTNEIYDDAVVIHYVGKEDKPWIYQDAALRELWDQYYQKTCYGAVELNRTTTERNLRYFANALKRSVEIRGIIATIKYIVDKNR